MLTLTLQNQATCNSNLDATHIASLTFDTTAANLANQSIDINKITYANGNVLVRPGNNTTLTGVTITQLKLNQFQELTAGSSYNAMLHIEATKTAGTYIGSSTLRKDIPLSLQTAYTTNPTAQITGCSGSNAGVPSSQGVVPPLVIEGDACTPDGSIGHDSTGALLSCQGGVWNPSKNYKGFVSVSFMFEKNINGAGFNALCTISGSGFNKLFTAPYFAGSGETSLNCEVGNGRLNMSVGPQGSDPSATVATVPYLFDCVPSSSVFMTYPMGACTGVSSSSVTDNSGRAYLWLSGPSCNAGTTIWGGITDPKFSVRISATCKYK